MSIAKVPLLVDEQDIDLLHQALSALKNKAKSLGMSLPDIGDLEKRLGEAEDRLIEGGGSNACRPE